MELYNQKGSIVVEAAIVFPFIFIVLVLMLYLSVIFYQKAYLEVLTHKIAERGVIVWNSPSKDLVTGKVYKDNINDEWLYRRLFENDKVAKENALKKFADSSNDLIAGSKPQIEVKLEDYFAYKKLIVSARQGYKLPIGGVTKIIGLGDTFYINAKAESVINEPQEFIRNVDLLMDIEGVAEYNYEGYKNFVQRIRDSIDNTEKSIKSIF